MKVVYQSVDGTIHNTEGSAIANDIYCNEINNILNKYPFNGPSDSFIQRTRADVNWIINEVAYLFKNSGMTELYDLWQKNPYGIVGRILDDGQNYAARAYYLLISFDKNNRQWSQPYYANQANKQIG